MNDIKTIQIIAEAIRIAGKIPSGHLYAMIMDKISLQTYNTIIDILKDEKHLGESALIEEKNHLLIWKGVEKCNPAQNTTAQ